MSEEEISELCKRFPKNMQEFGNMCETEGYNQALKDAQEQCRKEFMDDRWEIIPTLFLIRIHCVGCIKGLEKQEGK